MKREEEKNDLFGYLLVVVWTLSALISVTIATAVVWAIIRLVLKYT